MPTFPVHLNIVEGNVQNQEASLNTAWLFQHNSLTCKVRNYAFNIDD